MGLWDGDRDTGMGTGIWSKGWGSAGVLQGDQDWIPGLGTTSCN